MRQLLSRLRAYFRSGALDRDFDRELEAHLDLLAEEYCRSGMTPDEARREARLRLGGTAQLREAHRETRGLPMLETLFQDLRYGLRTLRKDPGFTSLAVLTLALGIGVNTAVFTLYNASVLRPLQAVEPGRVVQFAHNGRDQFFSYPEYVYYRDSSRLLSGLAAMSTRVVSMSGVSGQAASVAGGITGAAGLQFPKVLGGSEPVTATVVSGNYFQFLGVSAAFGRNFLPEEDTVSAPAVAMLSDNFWERRFSRDPGVLGHKLTLNGADVTIVGITQRDFGGTWLTVPDLWMPLAVSARLSAGQDMLHDRNNQCCRVYGRLRPGVAPGQAGAEWNTLEAGWTNSEGGAPSSGHATGFLVGLASRGGQPGKSRDMGPALLILGAVGLVLLIACANVASLLLARSAARQREIAIRLAIGASRIRLVRQLLTENAIMSLLAGGLGIVFSWWTLRFLLIQVAASPFAGINMLALDIAPDQRVLGYMLFLALASTFAFGLAPALEASRSNLTAGMREEGTAFSGRLRKSRLRDGMVGAQVAVCLVLLIGAGLLARASQRALSVDVGFDYQNIVSLEVVFPPTASPAKIAATRMQLVQELERLPEIQSVAVASRLPLVHGGMHQFAVSVKGGPVDERGTPDAWYTLVTPGYFDALRIPIVRGRNFSAQEGRAGVDYNDSPVIVSESTARQFWPGEDPVGKRLSFGPRRQPGAPIDEAEARSASSVVIGVARDVRSWRLEREDGASLYLPVTSAYGGTATGSSGRPAGVIAMRTRGNEGAGVAAVRRLLLNSHGDLQVSIGDSRTAYTTQNAFAGSRVGALGAAIIGILGLLMTAVGIYGTVGFAVTRRTPEIGVRMALGATRGEVLRLVLGETMRPVAAGLAAGLLAAALVSRLLHAFLFGLSTVDPVAFLGVSNFLAAVALLAGYLPARRATRVDPMIALRYE